MSMHAVSVLRPDTPRDSHTHPNAIHQTTARLANKANKATSNRKSHPFEANERSLLGSRQDFVFGFDFAAPG
eukprot:64295-Rhodomonas_salina.1